MSLLRKITTPFSYLLIAVMTFSSTAIGRAAEKIRRSARRTRSNLKSSYVNYLTARALGYFHPSWDYPGKRTANNHFATELAEDPDHRLEADFRVPSRLKGRVAFWIEVYARFSSQYRIVHDRDNPELVYGYLDFRPFYRAFPRRMAHAKAYEMEKNILKILKARIAEAAGITNPRRPTLTQEEAESIREMLSRFGARDRESTITLLRRMRTQTGQKDFFLSGLHRSAKILPEIERYFKEHNLPLALTRLPFVETSFNPHAVSKSGAMGMWQFMPDTARLFDPRGTRREWADPIRQSRSAARMLKILRDRLPDWGIAITAYNSGGARLARIVERHGVDDIEELLEVPASKETLGFAGKNFYSEFLAANLVVAYKREIFSPRDSQASRIRAGRRIQSLLDSADESLPTVVLTKRKQGARRSHSRSRVASTPRAPKVLATNLRRSLKAPRRIAGARR